MNIEDLGFDGKVVSFGSVGGQSANQIAGSREPTPMKKLDWIQERC